jgi:transcription termination factor Rho
MSEAKEERERENPMGELLDITELKSKDMSELRALAEQFNINGRGRIKKEDLVFAILKAQAEKQGLHFKDGVLEILPDGYGFLRDRSCLPGAHDIYVSPSQIKRFALKDGDVVSGIVRPPKEEEKYFALLKIEAINFEDPEAIRNRQAFEDLIPYHPREQLKLEYDSNEFSTRIIDLFAPIGKGQRGLIVSPPKAGKTTLLKHIAHGIAANHPEVYLIVLLVDERPEEVTDFRESITMGEVVAATFDQKPEIHCRISELVIAKAKRLVEMGRDVVILMDSITRLGARVQLSYCPQRETPLRGHGPHGALQAQRVLRRRAQHQRRRQLDDHWHSPGGHRLTAGSSGL